MTIIVINDDGTQLQHGAIIYEDGLDEGDILDDVQDLQAVFRYIADRHPHGWRVKDGKILGEPIPCFVCKGRQDKSEMTRFVLSPDDLSIYLCPACKDIHWKEFSV